MNKRVLTVVAALAVFLGAGVAFAAWTTNGTGSGYAKARTAQALTTSSIAAVEGLYPGGAGNVKLSINNPNPYTVSLSAINGTGSGITSGNSTCDASNSVSFTNQNSGWNLLPGDNEITLTNAALMSTGSVDACQGLTFTIPVNLVGQSAS